METQLSCLRDLSGSRRVITPGTVVFSSLSFHHSLVLCDFNSVTPPLPLNPRGWVSFLLLEAHTTGFLDLEFQIGSCALLNCHCLNSNTPFLEAFTLRGLCWEHRVLGAQNNF